MSAERRADQGTASIGELREHALLFADSAPGPLRLLRMRAGDVLIEVQWQDVGPSAAAGAADGVAGAVAGAAAQGHAPAALAAAPVGTAAAAATTAAAAGAGPHQPAPPAAPAQRTLVSSPMVGTFYRAPAPGADPFVEVGDLVEPGQTIGIVEAMKLMNPIVAESAGQVIEILAGDAQPVEFGQALVALTAHGFADGAHPATRS